MYFDGGHFVVRLEGRFPESGTIQVVVQAVAVSMHGGIAAETARRIWGDVKASISNPGVAPRFENGKTNGRRKLGGNFTGGRDCGYEGVFWEVCWRWEEFIKAFVHVDGERVFEVVLS